jgi:hypothetical protein
MVHRQLTRSLGGLWRARRPCHKVRLGSLTKHAHGLGRLFGSRSRSWGSRGERFPVLRRADRRCAARLDRCSGCRGGRSRRGRHSSRGGLPAGFVEHLVVKLEQDGLLVRQPGMLECLLGRRSLFPIDGQERRNHGLGWNTEVSRSSRFYKIKPHHSLRCPRDPGWSCRNRQPECASKPPNRRSSRTEA